MKKNIDLFKLLFNSDEGCDESRWLALTQSECLYVFNNF